MKLLGTNIQQVVKKQPKYNLSNQVIGLWTVSSEFKWKEQTGQVRLFWKCRCACGTERFVEELNLRKGLSTSCGCTRKIQGRHKFTHSKNPIDLKFYRTWKSIRSRCTNPNVERYPQYGGKGIKVCERCDLFENFKEDMYESYLKHIEDFGMDDTSINRKDVKGNYEKDNCEWATRIEQARNTTISANSVNYNEHDKWKNYFTMWVGTYFRKGCPDSLAKFTHYIGCTPEELKQYLETKFQFGMTWENRGLAKNGERRWQVDHIIECNKFDLSKEEDRLVCFNYKNLQPLWWSDNNRKM